MLNLIYYNNKFRQILKCPTRIVLTSEALERLSEFVNANYLLLVLKAIVVNKVNDLKVVIYIPSNLISLVFIITFTLM